ncbi:TPA: type I DNA topoisomerase, partial [bacterium]|nr:type I DNA topoisomerase [bacterium]
MKDLIIVESPTKARTIIKYIGDNYKAIASMGHIKDLPEDSLGIDIEKGFAPKYVVISGKRKTIQEIKELSQKTKDLFLATDPDREGEAIAWHISSELKKKPYRLILHEITKEAIKDALSHPTEIDKNKVDAQQARRLLDRLVGYKISPILGQKVQKGLSAGRVQSVALRLIVERENEIEAHIPEEYWTITAKLKKDDEEFEAVLEKYLGKKLKIKTKNEADEIISKIDDSFIVERIESKEKKKQPPPPFITSKLQQEANQRLSFPAKKTMFIAQGLYEGIDVGKEGPIGLITYMRTDSVRVSDSAISEIRSYIKEVFGDKYLPPTKRVYKNKNIAQDAHEAIRPTFPLHLPSDIKKYLSNEQYKLYDLITRRFIASQMQDARILTTKVELKNKDYTFVASGKVILFDGFIKVYPVDEKEKILPTLKVSENVFLVELIPKQHFTQPPPRYTEGSLVKALEENGIGRPSTYATIISTLMDRKYIEKKEEKLYPTGLGRLVWELLLENFPKLFEVKFTAEMEDDLDKIEEGKEDWKDVLTLFYEPFSRMIDDAKKHMRNVKKEKEKETDIVCEKCGGKMIIKEGRYGKFLA